MEIVTKVTTPLALAALCLLLVGGIAKAITKKKSSVALNSLVRWGFIVSLILGILANVSFVIISGFAREVRLAGTVRDEANNPVSFAIVDLGGNKGRGITDDYGQFEINVPASRVVPKYKMTISAEGFVITNVPVDGPRPKDPVEICLVHPNFTADNFTKTEPVAVVRHYLGNPSVLLTLDFANPCARKISLDELMLTLTDPSGKTIPLSFEGMVMPNGFQMPAILPCIPLEKSQKWTTACSFCYRDDGILAEVSKAQAEVPLLKKTPSPNEQIYSTGLATELAEFMRGRMIWKPGDWKGSITWLVDGKPYAREFHFSLSADDVTRMAAISKYYATGYGIVTAIAFSQVGDANPAINVRLRN